MLLKIAIFVSIPCSCAMVFRSSFSFPRRYFFSIYCFHMVVHHIFNLTDILPVTNIVNNIIQQQQKNRPHSTGHTLHWYDLCNSVASKRLQKLVKTLTCTSAIALYHSITLFCYMGKTKKPLANSICTGTQCMVLHHKGDALYTSLHLNWGVFNSNSYANLCSTFPPTSCSTSWIHMRLGENCQQYQPSMSFIHEYS